MNYYAAEQLAHQRQRELLREALEHQAVRAALAEARRGRSEERAQAGATTPPNLMTRLVLWFGGGRASQ